MPTEAVLRRLAALNRQPIAPPPERNRPRQKDDDTVRGHSLTKRQNPVALNWFDRGEVIHNGSGQFYRIGISLQELWKDADDHLARYNERPAKTISSVRSHPELDAFVTHFPHQVVLVDLETCGFSGSSLFLIGVLRHVGGELVVELLLARNYAEERAILEAFWQIADLSMVLVTFNGKCFDWPMICDRSTRHHLERHLRRTISTAEVPTRVANRPRPQTDLGPFLIHCDLLHHARRRWKTTLPDCKLQTLEQYLCGRLRRGDIPGRQIPDAYHRYVRTGDPRQLCLILHHNALDLITLLELALRIASPAGSFGRNERLVG